MSSSHRTLPRAAVRFPVYGTLIAAFSLGGSASASAAEHTAAADCAGVDVAPAVDTIDAVRAGILCLTNAERAQRGLVVLREDSRLRRAALAHSSDMVHSGYFAHSAPDGDTFVDRIVAARYVRRYDGWMLGENLAWGTGGIGTARGVHEAWMRSSGHRAIILKPAYRELGIGVRRGIPKDADVGATFTIDFGVKT
jgi:uncharacterized protein YkwD